MIAYGITPAGRVSRAAQREYDPESAQAAQHREEEAPKPYRLERPARGHEVTVDGVAYMSCKEADRALGLPEGTLQKVVSGQRRLPGHIVEGVVQAPKSRRMRPVYVDDTLYASAKEAAVELGVTPGSVRHAARKHHPCVGHHVRYAR